MDWGQLAAALEVGALTGLNWLPWHETALETPPLPHLRLTIGNTYF